MVIKKEEHYFYTCDNNTLKSLDEMLEWIKDSHNHSFSHHVNAERNDFSGWAKQVLKDSPLAKKLIPNMSKEEVIEAIEKRLEQKNKKKDKKKKIISQIKEAINDS